LRKRKHLVGVAVVVVALVTAAVALAATQRTYKQTFAASATGKTTTKPGKPTGSYFVETANDPSNEANNGQPKQDKAVDDIFPPGTVIDQSIPANCNASDQDFQNKTDGGCKKKSIVGSGNATLKTKFNGAPPINATITAYNDKTKKQLIFYVNPSGVNPIVLRGDIKGKKGSQSLHVPIPISCVLGNPPTCEANGSNAGDARITRFELTINKVTKKVGKPGKKKTKGFLTTPKTCPASGNWIFTIMFHGRDGITDTLHSPTACKK
jgi:hypothetical protein